MFALKRVGVVALALIVSACSGIELGAKAGIYRVDEMQSSQRTHHNKQPLKCLFSNFAGCEDYSMEK